MDAKTPSLKTLAGTILILFFLEGLNSAVSSPVSWPPLFLLGGIRILEVLFILLLVSKVEDSGSGNALSRIGLGPDQLLPGIFKGMLWSSGFAALTICGGTVLYLMGQNPLELFRTTLPENQLEKILFFIVGGLVAPVAEEIVFRGVLYGYLRRWGAILAVIGSTIVFAGAHAGVSVVQITGGLVFAISFELEKKLMTPIVIHVLGNLALFSLSAFF